MAELRASGPQIDVEVELKFDADPVVQLPDLRRLPGVDRVEEPVELELTATYFDTPDLRLARSRTTLRRRTGGEDDGWHLKLPRKSDERVELRRPLGRSVRTPPKALLDLVQVRVRGEALLPTAEVRTHRTVRRVLDGDGVALAEVADDRVTARVLGVPGQTDGSVLTWREVEVELLGGDRSILTAAEEHLLGAGCSRAALSSKLQRLLAARLPDAPVPAELTKKSSAGAVALAHLREQAAALMAWDPYARLDEPDAVHKMRVSSRRLRSALATFRPLLDQSLAEPLRTELRWLGAVLGKPRDAEVIHERLTRLVAEQPPELLHGPVRRRVDRELRTRHRDALAAMRSELNGARYFELLGTLDTLIASGLDDSGAARRKASAVLPGLVAKARRRVLRAAKRAEQAEPGEAREVELHEVRKAAKRARYAAESVEPVFGPPAAAFAAEMESLQEVLGELQDRATSRSVLRELGVQAHLAGESGFAFGRLHGLEQASDEAGYQGALDRVQGKKPKWMR